MKHFYYLKSLLLVALLAFCSNAMADDVTVSIKNTDFTDNYSSSGASGTITRTVSSEDDLTISYAGIKTRSSATANEYSYGYAMFLQNLGYVYSSTAPEGYYVKSVSATFTSGTGTKGKVGATLGADAIDSRNANVTGAVTQSGTYTLENDDQTLIYWNFSTTNSNVQIASLSVVYAPKAAVSVDQPVISPSTGTFPNAQKVSITGPAGCKIYYTTDGTQPTDGSSLYSDPFTVEETTTIKAIAVNDDDESSTVATSVITILPTYSTIADLATTSTSDQPCFIAFNNWLVTGANSNNAYLIDANGDGAILYASNHGFNQGDKISGTVQGVHVLYNGQTEIKSVFKNSTGLTVTSNNEVPATVKTIDAISESDFANVVTIKNVKFNRTSYLNDANNTTTLTDGTNTIAVYNTFGKLQNLTLSTEASYDVTGVVIKYKNGDDIELRIAPRLESDVVCQLVSANSSWSAEKEIVKMSGTLQATFSTNYKGAVTYESSNTAVMDYDLEDGWQIVGKGVTTLKATTPEDATYYKSEAEMTVYVIADNEDMAMWVVADEGLENATALTSYNIDTKTTISFAKGEGTNAPKYYTVDKTARTYYGNTITVACEGGYGIKSITFHFYKESATKEYPGEFTVNGGTYTKAIDATWTGFSEKVVFTVGNTNRLLGVDVVYADGAEAYTREVTAGNFGTLCINRESTCFNATFYSIAGTRLNNGEVCGVVLEEVKVLEAGKPYIFLCNESELKVVYDFNSTVVDEVVAATGLVGNLSETHDVPTNCYVISQNKIRKVEEDGHATFGSNRAYLDLSEVNEYQEPSQTTTKRTVELGVAGSTTAINAISSEVEDAIIFDLTGRRVNKMDKGIYIVNGKKVVVR